MTNLEFINEKIKETKQSIRHWEMQLENYTNEEVLTKCLNKRKEELKNLLQIKTELEAWGIAISKKVDLYDIIITVDYKQYESENNDLLKEYFLNKKEYEIIKKALEVENAN